MRRRTPRWIRLSDADRHELQSLMMDGRTEQRVGSSSADEAIGTLLDVDAQEPLVGAVENGAVDLAERDRDRVELYAALGRFAGVEPDVRDLG